jgi:hypothetical protein
MGAGSSKIDEDVGNLNKNFDDLLSNFNTYKNVETVRTYQPKGDYASKGDLSSYQPKGEYQPKGDYAYRGDLSNYQPKGDYAFKGDLSSYQPKGEYQPKGDYQPRGEYQPRGDYQPRGEYALKTDDPANIDYGKLAGKISAVDTYNRKIAEQIAASPGVLGESLNEKISNNDAFISKVGRLLEGNDVFTDSVVNILTDATKGFRDRIVGPKGDPGELSGNVAMIKKNLYDKKMTVWCADGDVCNLPVGSKGFVSGEDIILTPKSNVNVAGNANVSGKLDVVGDSKFGNANVSGKLDVVGDAKFAGFSATNANVSGKLDVVGGNMKLGDTHLTPGADGWFRLLSDPTNTNSYNKGVAADKLWSKGDSWVGGRLDVKGDTQFEGIWANKGLSIGGDGKVNGKLDVVGNIATNGHMRLGDTHLTNGGADGWFRLLSDPSDIKSYNKGLAVNQLWSKGDSWVGGNANVDGHMKIGDTHLTNGGADGWIRLLSDPKDIKSYNKGLAVNQLWSKGDSWIGGNANVGGNMKLDGHMKIGDTHLTNGGEDGYIRFLSDPKDNTSYNKGVAADKLWSKGDSWVNGTLNVARINVGGWIIDPLYGDLRIHNGDVNSPSLIVNANGHIYSRTRGFDTPI